MRRKEAQDGDKRPVPEYPEGEDLRKDDEKGMTKEERWNGNKGRGFVDV